jgi:K+-sensing histidine kinase KdpD
MTTDIAVRPRLRVLPRSGPHAEPARVGDRLVRRPTDLLAVVEEVARRMRGRALRRGVHLLHPRPVAGICAVVDADGVHSALLALVENAVHRAPAGSHVYVEVSRGQIAAALTVTDQGPGIFPAFGAPPLEFPNARWETGARGPGLAQADLVDQAHLVDRADLVARAHRGALLLERNHPQGLRARLELPLEQLLMTA